MSEAVVPQRGEFVAAQGDFRFRTSPHQVLAARINQATCMFAGGKRQPCTHWLLPSFLLRNHICPLVSHFTLRKTRLVREQGTFEVQEEQLVLALNRRYWGGNNGPRTFNPAVSRGNSAYSMAGLERISNPDLKEWSFQCLTMGNNHHSQRKRRAVLTKAGHSARFQLASREDVIPKGPGEPFCNCGRTSKSEALFGRNLMGMKNPPSKEVVQ